MFQELMEETVVSHIPHDSEVNLLCEVQSEPHRHDSGLSGKECSHQHKGDNQAANNHIESSKEEGPPI